MYITLAESLSALTANRYLGTNNMDPFQPLSGFRGETSKQMIGRALIGYIKTGIEDVTCYINATQKDIRRADSMTI